MKTYLLSFLLCSFFFSFAQNDDLQYTVTKEYDKNGNLIRYDSTRTKKNRWSSSHFSFSFNDNTIDSLINGFDFIGEKMNSHFSDSIAKKTENLI